MPLGSTQQTPGPLTGWHFDGTLRHYQADVMERVDVTAGSPLHIVAPPGSGKTLLGLLLAARRGRRTVVLAPTVTIRAQWAGAAASLVPSADAGPASEAGATVPAVSEDPEHLGDLTVLTYQALSVLDSTGPFAALAATRWRGELEGDGRSPDAAETWLDDLRERNPSAYQAGIARRSRTLRRNLVREDPEVLATALHPNARALIDRLVAHGVETIVLDECHHLLDHWALVVATLVARLRAAGREPLLIGLTATLPSPDDADEYENYTSLLGEVDYEVPVPAVVKEGNLAPYRDLVRFVEPTRAELAFLEAHANGLAVLIRLTFARETGVAFLVAALQPELPAPPARSELEPPPAARSAADEIDTRLAAAFAADFAGSEAIAAMLATVAPQHPIVSALPPEARRPPTADEMLRLLARFALDRVLPDPSMGEQWERIRRTLADFGYALTDRGVRRTRDPIDTMLASSLAKDHAVCDILLAERAQLGDDRLRALVVTDFAEHGNRHGGLIGGAGALRTFEILVTDAATRSLRAVLVTGGRTRIGARDTDVLVPALMDVLGVPVAAVPRRESPDVCELYAPGAGTAAIVRAVSTLLTRGTIHVVIGTRGLFGEGWDCPAVNTLIDLTAVATASATQQLRGRTLRLDPAWPEKVAHNWTVTALLPATFPLDAAPDASRLRRKHERLWGLDRDDPVRIVRGLGTVMSGQQQAALGALLRRDGVSAPIAGGRSSPVLTVDALNALGEVPARAITHAQWRIGEEYTDLESVSAVVVRRPSAPVFRTSRPVSAALGGTVAVLAAIVASGAALAWFAEETVLVVLGLGLVIGAVWLSAPLVAALWRTRGQVTHTDDAYRRMAEVVWEGLRGSGRIADVPAPSMRVIAGPALGGTISLSVECRDASGADQRALALALTELFGPVRTPRFLIQTGRGARSRIVEAVLRVAGRRREEHYLPVPSAIGRRREDAVAFAARWQRAIGPCVLHALDHPDQLALAARARRGNDDLPRPVTREQWR